MAKNPFDYVKAINHTKEYNFDKDYNPFITNLAFSYYPDTIMHANKMNVNHHLSPKLQYDYLFASIRAKARYTKWFKTSEPADLELVMQYYKYSASKAKEALSILTTQQLQQIKKELDQGGVK